MKRLAFLLLAILALCGCRAETKPEPTVHHTQYSLLPVWHPAYQTAYVETYSSGEPADDELAGVQCPIPMNCRVRNYTGSQCVFASLECLARWAECKELLEPQPLTSRPGCQGESGPADASRKLTKFGVRHEVTFQDRQAGLAMIRKAMEDKRGALFGVPGHAMVICHFDEAKKVVKIIDNSDRSLRIQTWSLDAFMARWDTWVMVLYAEPDRFGISLPNRIPIIDRNGPQGEYPKDYIPLPEQE